MITRRVPLGEVLELRREVESVEIDRSYRAIGVRGFGRGIFEYPPTGGGDLGKLRFFGLAANRLVVSNIKGWEGAVAVTGPGEQGRIASNRFLTYASNSAHVDLAYVAHWLLSDDGLEALGTASPGSADRNRTLSMKNFEAIEAPLPKLAEQRRIASHLGKVETEARRLLTAQTHRRAAISAFAESKWGGDIARVGDLVDSVTHPINVDEETTYRMHGVRWYGQGLFVRESKRGCDLAAKTVYRIRDGDLVYNRLFAWKQSFALAEGVGKAFVSNEFPVFRVKESLVLPRFLLGVLLTSRTGQQVDAASSGSTPTSRNRLKVPDFLDLTVEVPSMKVQRKVVEGLALSRQILTLDDEQRVRANALLPAARNEIFSTMR